MEPQRAGIDAIIQQDAAHRPAGRVLMLSTEGAIDPEAYQRIVSA